MIKTKQKLILLLAILLLITTLFSIFTLSKQQVYAHTHDEIENLAVEGEPNSYLVSDYVSGGQHKGVTFTGYYFGTTEDSKLPFVVQIYNSSLYAKDEKVKKLATEIHNAVDYLDGIANTQYTTSDVYRFNNAQADQGDTISISNETAQMIMTAKSMYTLTNGAYNPCVYRLVDLWGFSSRTYYDNRYLNLPYDRKWTANSDGTLGYPTPDTKYIDAFKKLCDFDSVVLGGDEQTGYTLTKNCPAVTVDGETYEQWLDLGGIAKGFAVDEVRAILKNYGIEHYFINSASSSLAMTSTESDSAFNLSVTNPDKIFGYYCALSIKDKNISTSGQYVRKYTYNGTTYSHIIDGKTGYPATTGITTVTLVGGSSAENDCLTTALTVLGKDNLVAFMNTKYVWDNDLKIVAVYDQASSWDKKKPILTNYKTEEFLEINDDFYIGTTITPTADNKLLEQGIEFLVSFGSANVGQIALIVIVSIAGVLVLAIVIYNIIVNRHKIPKFNIVAVRKDKPFKWVDAVVYTALIALIVVLFGVFVFGNESQAITTVKVNSLTTGETLFTYDTATDSYFVANTENFEIEVQDNDNELVLTIYQTIGKSERNNVLTITKGQNMTVKMTNSVCGLHQECVKNFPAITSADGVIVCSPNGIKVSTTDTADYILI